MYIISRISSYVDIHPMNITACISSYVYMQINHCLRCNHEWPSKLEKSRTCAKCRSPYWDVPKRTLAVDDGSYAPAAVDISQYDLPEVTGFKKNFSPAEITKSIQNRFPEEIRKPLHDRSEEAKKSIIESMRGIVDKTHPDYKTKPITPNYAPKPVVDQPDYYDNESSVKYD